MVVRASARMLEGFIVVKWRLLVVRGVAANGMNNSAGMNGVVGGLRWGFVSVLRSRKSCGGVGCNVRK